MSVNSDGAGTKPTPPVLDADTLIDEILATKGPQKYKDGLSEDNWEEELEQIPLFMSKVPDHIDPEKGAGILALQDLKYQEDNPDCRALAYKEDGNELFKKKKYKDAITAYTDGLKQGSTDPQIKALLYCNRAASHYFIGNMRSSISDATQSKSLKPDHVKAYIRGAEGNFKLGKHGEALQWCEEGLRVDPTNQRLKVLQMKATQEKKKSDRDKRKQGIAEKVRKAEHQNLLDAIMARHVRLARTPEEAQGYKDESDDEGGEKGLEHLIGDLHLTGAHPITKPVHLDKENRLVWPVIFLYPEYGQSEVILEFNEDSMFADHIQAMFGDESALWDAERKYTPQRIEVWFEDLSKGGYVPVPLDSTLRSVINGRSRYTVISGTPSFIILARGSKFKEDFLVRI